MIASDLSVYGSLTMKGSIIMDRVRGGGGGELGKGKGLGVGVGKEE